MYFKEMLDNVLPDRKKENVRVKDKMKYSGVI